MPELVLDGQLAAENAVLRAENARLRTENAALRAEHDELERMLAALTQRVAELERQLASMGTFSGYQRRADAVSHPRGTHPSPLDAPRNEINKKALDTSRTPAT